MTPRRTDTRKTGRGTWPLARVLRERNAGLYLAGVVVSGFGTSALWLAAGVWVKDLTGSDGLAALCMLAMWAPTLVGPALGTTADRVRRKPLPIAANLLPAALLPALCAVDSPDALWLLFAVLFGYGVAGRAGRGRVGARGRRRRSAPARRLHRTAHDRQRGMKLVAPLAGAGLYTAYGGPSVAALDAAAFVVATGLYAALRVREAPPERPAVNRRRQTAEGVRYLWAHPRLRPLVLAGGVTMLCAGVGGATLYAVVDALGRSPAYAGVLHAVQGAGSVVVGVVSAPPCAAWAHDGSGRPGSPCSRSRWRRGESLPKRSPGCPVRRSAWACRRS
ncbi:hypothetical protein GCM10010279_57110 [Streptomyces mutabilis]|nr:hypothetical protein GCM10010279_57110 [Streptomyces mutabilis]